MNAVWMRARVEVRAGWRSIVALSVITALFGGMVFASVAGARRTHSAVPRLLASGWQPDGQVEVDNADPGGAALGSSLDLFDAIRRLPQVRDSGEGAYTFAGAVDVRGRPLGDLGSVSAEAVISGALPANKLVAGRSFDSNAPDEVMLNTVAARLLHAHVGTTFGMAGFAPDQIDALFHGAQIQPSVKLPPVRVVGIVLAVRDLPLSNAPTDVQWLGNGTMVLTPAWYAAHGAQVGNLPGLSVRLNHGMRDAAAFSAALAELTHGRAQFFPGSDDAQAAVQAQRGTNISSFALLMFALLSACAFLLVVGQGIARMMYLSTDDYPALRALGFSRGQLLGLSLVRAGIVAVAGAVFALGVAVALSPLTPIGLARTAEIHPGVSADWFVLGIGLPSVIVALFAVAIWPGLRATRARAVDGERTSRTADSLSRAGMPAAAVAGVRLALEPGHGRTAVPVRSTLLASALALAALVASVVFGFSLQHLGTRPDLQGWTWDVAVGNPHSPDLAAGAIPKLRAIPGVTAIAGDALTEVRIDGHDDIVVGWDPVQGSVTPTMISGRLPAASDEIALGGNELRALHRSIGDTVTVDADGAPHPLRLRITGQVLLSPWSANDQIELGSGGVLSLQSARALVPDTPENMFLVRATPDAVKQIRRAFPSQAMGATRPTDVQDLQSVVGFPLALAVLLIVLALATIAHTLLTSVRRRRRDIAVLKTLGFVRRQVRATIAWQATTIVAVALVVGLTAGIITGRWAWLTYAERSAIVPTAAVPALLLIAFVPAALAIANILATFPARAAARTPPAEVLRTE